MTQTGFAWEADVREPISGKTPLARHCSATGAQAASLTAGSKLARLLEEFSKASRLTLNETAARLNVQDHSLCSTWDRAKYELGWIDETGAVKRVPCRVRVVTKTNRRKGETIGDTTEVFREQAYHRITKAGRQAAFDLLKVRVAAIEDRQ